VVKDSAQLCAAIRGFAVDNKRVRQERQDLKIKREAALFAITETMTSIIPAAQDNNGLKLRYRTAHMVL
jgi:hypothetical protein